MDKQRKQQRDRLVVLSFVSVLLVLMYGPGAPWFVGADRFLFDQFATHVRNKPLANGMIVSINPAKKSADEVAAEYGRVLKVLNDNEAGRIVIPQAPALETISELPGWAATLSTGVPVFAPAGHRLADVATATGILGLRTDSDNVLRQSRLWHLHGGIMSPSLPLAVALHDQNQATDPRISAADSAIYLTNYKPIERLEAEEVLANDFRASQVSGRPQPAR